MKPRPQTIQIFLPHGDPHGIRVADITTRIVQVIEVPRSLLGDFFEMPESKQVGMYFLCGGGEDGSEPKVYVGQTGDLQQRLAAHNKSKEFWQRALVLISRTSSLTQTHAVFLEWYCLQAVSKAARYVPENGNSGSRPHTPAPLEADCIEIFETGQVLLSTLGYPLFDAVGVAGARHDRREYRYTASGCNGRGLYTAEGFVVLKGSEGRRENVPSIANTSAGRFRERLIESGVMVVRGDRVVFSKDHLFGSPSMAGIALVGRTTNGWKEWKTEDGRTLDEVERGEEHQRDADS